MRGTTFKRRLASGSAAWAIQLDAGHDLTGKRIRITRGGFDRQADAQAELARLLQEAEDGLLVKPIPKTFGEFLSEWFQQHAVNQCSPKTTERYRQLADSYILPQLRDVQLRQLSALTLERLYGRLREAGGKEGRPLSVKTVRHVAGLVHVALNTAVRWKVLKLNPASACVLPKLPPREALALDKTGLEWYLAAASGHPYLYPILVLAAATGCRRGELLAVSWPDLDFTAGAVRISKSLEQTRNGLRIKPPKHGKTRTLSLPAIAVQVLQGHRQEQDRRHQLYGPDYRTDLDLVFANPEGDYLKPDTVTAEACRIARKAGLPKGVSLHTLRHSHGSQLLAAGIPLPTVSKRLGHANPQVTAAIYSHGFAADEVAAAQVWDSAMRSVISGTASRQ